MPSFRYNFILFIIFVLFLIIEGIYSAYYYKVSAIINFLEFKSKSSISPHIWNENGLVEILQNILLIFSIYYFYQFFKKINFKNETKIFSIIVWFYFIGLFYYFFEEISWGQHFFYWDSPKFFLNYNNQNETNIHNISNLFNELPRSILLIWCSLSFTLPLIFKKYSWFEKFKKLVLPNEDLRLISILLLIFVIPDLIVKIFNLHPGHPVDYTTRIRLYEVIEFFSFNFIRLSELHELIIDYYILAHAYYLKNLNLISKTWVEPLYKTK